MFYDNFTEEQICGLFTPWHFVAIACIILFVTLGLVFSRKMSEKQANRTILIVAILVTVMEVIKIILRLIKGASGDGWIPLYMCSLFIYAIWLTFSKNQFFKNMGFAFIVFGGMFSAFTFTIYPSTSLMLYPIWHPSSLHSLLYHGLMFYTGGLVMLKGLYQPKPKHFLNYVCFVGICTILAVIINSFAGTNMMFMSNPFGLPILSNIANYSKFLYGLIVFIGQGVFLYWGCYGIYLGIKKIKEVFERKQKNK